VSGSARRHLGDRASRVRTGNSRVVSLHPAKGETAVSILWIIIVVLVVLALLGFVGRGRW
jgi:hypothetical protein